MNIGGSTSYLLFQGAPRSTSVVQNDLVHWGSVFSPMSVIYCKHRIRLSF